MDNRRQSTNLEDELEIRSVQSKSDSVEIDGINLSPEDELVKVEDLRSIADKGSIILVTKEGPEDELVRVEDLRSITDKGSALSVNKEDFTSSKTKPLPKTVSFNFLVKDFSLSEHTEEIYDASKVTYSSPTNSIELGDQTSPYLFSKVPSFNSSKTSTLRSMPLPVLENIPEVDENVSEVSEKPGYYGWDGFEAKFKESIEGDDSWSSLPKCIPPWAKSIKKSYGLASLESYDEDEKVEESRRIMQDKIENLMKKHKELMLMKRVESKKHLIIEPSKDTDEMDTIQMRAKSTRYYLTPLDLKETKTSTEEESIFEKKKVSSSSDSRSMSITKKTSRTKAKREIAQVLQSLPKTVSKERNKEEKIEYEIKKETERCPKITLSNIREFVNMSPNEKKLHQIIRIENIPSVQDLKESCKPFSKYIINVPQSKRSDKPSLNVIKIKEKRKLRVESIENIEEKVTELHYNKGETRCREKKGKDYFLRDSYDTEQMEYIRKKIKSPTETKTFEVKTKQTPLIAPIVEDKNVEKVLLLQYDKKSKKHLKEGKSSAHTTKILGVKESCADDHREMYLYGSETDGKKVSEKFAEIGAIPPTLKDKVHLIFEELKGLAIKQKDSSDMVSSQVQVCPTVDTKTTQRPSILQTTEVAMVEAKPEMRSASVQVRQSQILASKSDLFTAVTPHPTPTSSSPQEHRVSYLDADILQEKLEDLAPDEYLSNEFLSSDEERKETKAVIEESSVNENQQFFDKDKQQNEIDIDKRKTISEEEKRADISPAEILDTTSKTEELSINKTKLEDEIKEEGEIKEEDETKTILDQEKVSIGEVVKEDVVTDEELKKESLSKASKTTLVEDKSKEEEKEPTDKLEQNQMFPTPQKKLSKLFSKKSTEQLSSVEDNVSISEGSRKYLHDDDEETLTKLKLSLSKDQEDIRSYEFDPHQASELVMKSSSKFLHKKEALRKRMNWTDDTIYLENHTCPQLIRGLAETAMRRPTDPIAFLANWIYKDCESRERGEREEVRHEHLQLARAMAEVADRADGQPRKKFNVRKYPIVKSIVEENEVGEHEEDIEFKDNLENIGQKTEIAQEA